MIKVKTIFYHFDFNNFISDFVRYNNIELFHFFFVKWTNISTKYQYQNDKKTIPIRKSNPIVI
jgi:hypothetical protein